MTAGNYSCNNFSNIRNRSNIKICVDFHSVFIHFGMVTLITLRYVTIRYERAHYSTSIDFIFNVLYVSAQNPALLNTIFMLITNQIPKQHVLCTTLLLCLKQMHSLQLDLLMEYAIVQIKNKKLCNAGESSIFLPTGK